MTLIDLTLVLGAATCYAVALDVYTYSLLWLPATASMVALVVVAVRRS